MLRAFTQWAGLSFSVFSSGSISVFQLQCLSLTEQIIQLSAWAAYVSTAIVYWALSASKNVGDTAAAPATPPEQTWCWPR